VLYLQTQPWEGKSERLLTGVQAHDVHYLLTPGDVSPRFADEEAHDVRKVDEF
jgi:hypothetical protein